MIFIAYGAAEFLYCPWMELFKNISLIRGIILTRKTKVSKKADHQQTEAKTFPAQYNILQWLPGIHEHK